jgi:hypothetical protein
MSLRLRELRNHSAFKKGFVDFVLKLVKPLKKGTVLKSEDT